MIIDISVKKRLLSQFVKVVFYVLLGFFSIAVEFRVVTQEALFRPEGIRDAVLTFSPALKCLSLRSN